MGLQFSAARIQIAADEVELRRIAAIRFAGIASGGNEIPTPWAQSTLLRQRLWESPLR
jgi:hypothetical protein